MNPRISNSPRAVPSDGRNPYRHIKKVDGKRSGLEAAVAADLLSKGVDFKGEKVIKAIEYSNLRVRKYHADFQLPNGIIVECKGWFKTSDRTKHLCIKHQHPEYDIRFVFSNSKSKIGSKSKTTYADWCTRHGFKYADRLIPNEWWYEADTVPKTIEGDDAPKGNHAST